MSKRCELWPNIKKTNFDEKANDKCLVPYSKAKISERKIVFRSDNCITWTRIETFSLSTHCTCKQRRGEINYFRYRGIGTLLGYFGSANLSCMYFRYHAVVLKPDIEQANSPNLSIHIWCAYIGRFWLNQFILDPWLTFALDLVRLLRLFYYH